MQTSSALPSSLAPLLQDIAMPPFLSGTRLSHTNLWMCTR